MNYYALKRQYRKRIEIVLCVVLVGLFVLFHVTGNVSFMLAMIVLLPLAMLWIWEPIVWMAIRTGRLLTSVAVFHRDQRPAIFYLGIGFWLFLFIGFSLLAVVILTHR
jgi:hypothetical protein